MLARSAAAFAQQNTGAPVPDPPAEWQKAGIDAREAEAWIQAQIPFAQWARQWKGEGFSPAEARGWVHTVNVYTARAFRDGGFTAAQAVQWIEQGVGGAVRAAEFRDRGFTPAEAGEWWRRKFFPEDASEWKQAGFTATDALAWKYGEPEYHDSGRFRSFSRQLFSSEWAAQWRGGGFTLDEARRAALYDVSFGEAMEWRTAGFGFDEAMFWRDAGFAPAAAAAERHAGRSAVDAEDRANEDRAATADTIESFTIDIALRPDATLDVAETIQFTNRPGGLVDGCFTRVFPGAVALRRHDGSRQTGWPRHHIRTVLHNGTRAQYTTAYDRNGGATLCIGGARQKLSEGPHTFLIAYTTDDRLISLPHHDRLSFAVKDASLDVPVRRATAAIRLPQGANTVAVDGFAGPPGRKYFSARLDETDHGDVITYTALRPLTGDMTFDVAVSLPKYVARASLWRRIQRFDRREGRILSSIAFFLSGIGAAAAYLLAVWWKVGRDPKASALMPVYEPPAELSPALGRYLLVRHRVDGRSVVATLVRLAQTGAVHIRERDGRYRLHKRGTGFGDCAAHEIEFFRRLFDGTSEVMVGTADARRRLRAARAALAKALRGERAKCIMTNRRYLWPAALLSLAGIALAVFVADEARGDAGVWHVVVMFAVASLLNLAFWPLLKAPTPAASALIGELRGFKAFLDVSYRDGVAAHLAYAIAFDVEHERASILDREIDWYTGTSGGFSAGDFTRSLYRLMPIEARA